MNSRKARSIACLNRDHVSAGNRENCLFHYPTRQDLANCLNVVSPTPLVAPTNTATRPGGRADTMRLFERRIASRGPWYLLAVRDYRISGRERLNTAHISRELEVLIHVTFGSSFGANNVSYLRYLAQSNLAQSKVAVLSSSLRLGHRKVDNENRLYTRHNVECAYDSRSLTYLV